MWACVCMCKCMFMHVNVCLTVCARVCLCARVHVQMCPLLPITCECWGRGMTLSLLCIPCCSSGRGINTRRAECLRLAEDWHTLAKGGVGAHPAPPLLRCEPEQRATDGVSPSSRVLAFLQLSAHQDSQTKPVSLSLTPNSASSRYLHSSVKNSHGPS